MKQERPRPDFGRGPGSLLAGSGNRREAARHFLDGVARDPVTHADVVVGGERDAALVAGFDLAHIVLEAAQGLDLPVANDRRIAEQAGAGTTLDDTFGDHASGDRADSRNREHLANIGVSERPFPSYRDEQATQRDADVLDQLVNDRIGPDTNAFPLRELVRLWRRPHIERDDRRTAGAARG